MDDDPADLKPGEFTDALNSRIGSSDQQMGNGGLETLLGEIPVQINASCIYYGYDVIGGEFLYEGFPEVIIGEQVWMRKNWAEAYPGSKSVSDDLDNDDIYGRLYNWTMIKESDFCPLGWRIPTEADIDELLTYVGGLMLAGGALKETGTDHWSEPNTGAEDSVNFKALPAGIFDVIFDLLGLSAEFWIDSEYNPVIEDIDGNEYHTVIVGSQEWIVESLRVTHYADGTPIPNLTLDADWIAEDNTPGHDGAYCWLNNDPLNAFRGALYNFYAVDNAHGLVYFTRNGDLEEGWRVPTRADWAALIASLGGLAVAGEALKEAGTDHWEVPNDHSTNTSGMTVLPSGARNCQFSGYVGISAAFENYETDFDADPPQVQGAYFYTSEVYSDLTPPAPDKFYAYYFVMSIQSSGISESYETSPVGFAIRCVRDL